MKYVSELNIQFDLRYIWFAPIPGYSSSPVPQVSDKV